MRTQKTSHKLNDLVFISLISFLTLLISFFHYSTPVHLHFLHELYRAFFYIPIILAAFRYQLKGGVYTAVTIIIIYLPHVVFQWGGDFLYNFSRFLEMVMYLVIGAVTGFFAQRERNEQQRYKLTAEKLEESYNQLRLQSEKITEIEEQLQHSERLSILGELSANLAHEIRNPLGSIWGVVEILENKCKNIGDQSEFFDILVKEVKRLNAVVDNYLNLAKRTQPVVKICNLNEAIQSVMMLLKQRAEKKQIHIETDLPTAPVYIKADENQLHQILINLLLNSISAIKQAGLIKIIVNKQNIHFVNLAITDTGKGIEPQHINSIFKPFYTTKESGTGLGLNIVKRIIDQYKWEIDVDSKIDAGTTITLTIPLENIDD